MKRTVLLLAAVAALSLPLSAQNLVTNGQFVDGLNGWTATGDVHLFSPSTTPSTSDIYFTCRECFPVPYLTQTITGVQPNTLYRLSFTVFGAGGGMTGQFYQGAFFGGTTVVDGYFGLGPEAIDAYGIQRFDYWVSSGSDETEDLSFRLQQGSALVGYTDVVLSPVPEPTSLVLVGSGLAALVGVSRRRQSDRRI